MPNKYILLVEDEVSFLLFWKKELEGYGYEIEYAERIETTLEVFPTKQWDAIVVDGCIGGDYFNSPPLIRKFKTESKPTCAIVAASRSEELSELMMEAGCTHSVSRKNHVPGLVHSILSQQ